MRRIVFVMMSTITAVVLLFSYRTSTNSALVAGSPGWMDAAERAVLRGGVPPECIHIERFAY